MNYDFGERGGGRRERLESSIQTFPTSDIPPCALTIEGFVVSKTHTGFASLLRRKVISIISPSPVR